MMNSMIKENDRGRENDCCTWLDIKLGQNMLFQQKDKSKRKLPTIT